ncbi:hypothetical protein ES332_A01G113200v1 [Gossypium tomentosum]|uniref:Uncharacterized protein n=1 Tax=Gossypium tomentosum TaxID=34277 RepID=A0A5D2RPB3_GOSTO|nr:hypothetical protein ES332_A01G113200v1 [Gossypium tomentosum]
MAIGHFHKPQTKCPFARRHFLFLSKTRHKAYFHSEIPISNSDFGGGNKDLVGASRSACTEKKTLVTWRSCVGISRGKLTLWCHSSIFQKLLALSGC